MGQNDIILNRRVVTVRNADYITKIENPSTGVFYIGKAVPGSATSSSVWQIKKLDTNTLALDKSYAGGVSTFTKVWDSRAGYTYS